jgi:Homeodomain-like domain
MIIVRGEVYLKEEHVPLLRDEEEYVKKRYRAVARTLAPDLVRITREEAAIMIGRSKRQLQRIVRRFREEGIPGLRLRSRAPHTTPRNKTPSDIETRVVEVRKATGFGSEQLAAIVNESLRLERSRNLTVTDTTCYNILARNRLVEAERRIRKKYKSFEWGHPDELIQSDLTSFNGLPILTLEDDHSRRGWAERVEDATDDSVVDGMAELHPKEYENLLTDNGKQFCRMNPTMRRYCEGHISGKHIWSSVHHPQTLGKLSNFQKGMKAFLIHRLGRSTDKDAIDECIAIYVDWYNNGKRIRTTKAYPEERYSGQRDPHWYSRLVRALKLDSLLPLPRDEGG